MADTLPAGAAAVDWTADGTPRSVRFGDTYYAGDGRAECAHVFLAGNDLPARWAGGAFHVAELGFGTGLNFLVTLAAWQAAQPGGRLIFTAVERYPLAEADRARALAPWPDLAALWSPWGARLDGRAGWQGVALGDVALRLGHGEAADCVAGIETPVDAWYLDGFSPAVNPAMWDAALMAAVAARTAPGGTFATFTAAGWVRRNLEAAGFAVTRAPGFGRKRHMTRGRLRYPTANGAPCQTGHGSA